jgi:hypothetical protein
MGYYTITDIAQGKIVCEETMIKKVMHIMRSKEVVITPGNYNGTSKGMEGKGCCRIPHHVHLQEGEAPPHGEDNHHQ